MDTRYRSGDQLRDYRSRERTAPPPSGNFKPKPSFKPKISNILTDMTAEEQAAAMAMHAKYGLPGGDTSGQVIINPEYITGYSFHTATPNWSMYAMNKELLAPDFGRTRDFPQDKRVPKRFRSANIDYKRSGYDRGHNFPRHKADSTREGMLRSFLLSNIFPQRPGLNREGWNEVELAVSEIINTAGGMVQITSGAEFKDAPVKRIGRGVGVPSHFYKVIYDEANKKMVGFIMPHKDIARDEIMKYLAPNIDAVEQFTGLDFNPELEGADELEAQPPDVRSLF